MTRVQILVFDGFDELDAVGPYEILRAAGLGAALVSVGGAAGEVVRGGHGLGTVVDGPLQAGPGLLVVPGGGFAAPTGGIHRALADGAVPAAIAEARAAGATIASVCTGAVLLEAAGVLAGRPVITHRAAIPYLRERGVDVREGARIVDDGDLLSAGGVTSGLDLALHLVERLVGPQEAERGAVRAEHTRLGPVVVTRGAPA